MALFISKTDDMVICYEGTRCSNRVPAELTHPLFIEKARRNPDFIEVEPKVEPPKVEKPVVVKKVTKKKVAKKKATKKKAKK